MMTFEKQFGDSKGIENAVVEKRRHEYEILVEKEPMNYDHWFAFAKLEEENGEWDKVREVYERAIGNKPPRTRRDIGDDTCIYGSIISYSKSWTRKITTVRGRLCENS